MTSSVLQSVFRAARPVRAREAQAFMRSCRSKSLHTASLPQNHIPHHKPSQSTPVRPFCTTSPVYATVATQNPRQDEDGNEMLITISDRAAKRLVKITSTPPQRNTLLSTQPQPQSTIPSDSHLRVTVTSGGCHGFQYLMSLESSSKIDPEEDTVFVSDSVSGGGDNGKGTAKVVLDESSLELLKGSTVDFTTELIGSQFKIVGNPRATSSCGCGTSFDIE